MAAIFARAVAALIVIGVVLAGGTATVRAQGRDDLAALNAQIAKLDQAGKYAEAIPLAQRSLELTRAQKGNDHLDTAARMSWLAGLYLSQGRYAEAEPLYKRSLALREKALGPDHPDVGITLNPLTPLSAIEDARKRLGNNGRLVIRPSGTEPVIRVMAEGDDRVLVERVVDDVVEVITLAAA